nr:histidine phosphatase family protein [Propionibacterium sp.]
MRLYLVRHGRTASNVAGLLDTAHPGAALDEVGLAQADALVDRLAEATLDAVYSSDIPRAVQTATPLAAARALALIPLAGLREIPAGDQEMRDVWDAYIDVLRAWALGRPHVRRPGGESGHEFFGRYDAAVASIADAGHSAAVLVSHGAALRTWVGHRVRDLTPMEVARRRLGNTAIVTIEGEPDDWRLLDWDDGVHHDTPAGRRPAGRRD